VINEAMARRYWPGENALGKRFGLSVEALVFAANGPPHLDFPSAMREVVGVVADVRSSGLTAAAEPEAYLPFAQRPARDMTVVLATTDSPAALAESVRRSVLELDKDQPVSTVRSLDAMVAESLGEPRFRTYLLAGFSAIALLLAAVGLMGLVAYAVTQRRREIGVRMALGAGQGEVLRMILTEGLRPVLAGILIGTFAAWAASRVLAGLLFGVTPTDPLTFVVIPLLLVVGASLACYLPARRVLRIDPAEAMQAE
jgi:putative ABC transport system permease protein